MRTISLSEVWHESRFGAEYEYIAGSKVPRPIMRVILFVLTLKVWLLAEVICKRRGHKWTTASDQPALACGLEVIVCRRCGTETQIDIF